MMAGMAKQIISVKEAPAAIGPYSQATRFGEFIFCSGQIPLDPVTGAVVEGGITEQTERVLQNCKALLTGAGSSLDKVLKTTVFLRDMNDFAAMNAVYSKYFTANTPARSTVQVARLPRDVAVEIECIATV
jgi:2-iminobutanoate/2-iminopropanoate deaminase